MCALSLTSPVVLWGRRRSLAPLEEVLLPLLVKVGARGRGRGRGRVKVRVRVRVRAWVGVGARVRVRVRGRGRVRLSILKFNLSPKKGLLYLEKV